MRKSKPLRQAQTEYRKPRPKSAKWQVENRVIPGWCGINWDDTWIVCAEYHHEDSARAEKDRLEMIENEFEYRIVERI